MANKGRIRKKVITGPDGQLKVIYVDVATGQEVTDPQNWDLESNDAPTVEATPTTANTETPSTSNVGQYSGGNGSSSNDGTRSGDTINTVVSQNGSTVPGGFAGLLEAAKSIGLLSGGGIVGKMLGLGGDVEVGKDGKPLLDKDGNTIPKKSGIEQIWDGITGAGKETPTEITKAPTGPDSVAPNAGNEEGAKVAIQPNEGASIQKASVPLNPSTPGMASAVNWSGYDKHLRPDVATTILGAQAYLDFPITLVSGYRDPERNKKAGGVGDSQHLEGNAVDISLKGLSDPQRTQLVRALAQVGAKRIGAYSGNTSIHMDMASDWDNDPRRKGYSAYPMFDKSANNMANAPKWFKDGLNGEKVPELPKAPFDPAVSPRLDRFPSLNDTRIEQASLRRPTTPAPNPALGDAFDDLHTAWAFNDKGNNPGNNKMAAATGANGTANLSGAAPIPDPLYTSGGRQIATAGTELAGTAQMSAKRPDVLNSDERLSKTLNGDDFQFGDMLNNADNQKIVDPVVPLTQKPSPFAPVAPTPMPAPTGTQPPSSKVRVIEVNPDGTEKVANTRDPLTDPIIKAYLNTLNKSEGSPAYNEAYNYVPFDDMSKHPDIYNKAANTTAAGKYQINSPTWNGVPGKDIGFAAKAGVTDFSPESQDKVAWKIAEENYKAKTGGGDLYSALMSGDPTTIATAFTKNKNRWVNLPGSVAGADSMVKEFNKSIAQPFIPAGYMPPYIAKQIDADNKKREDAMYAGKYADHLHTGVRSSNIEDRQNTDNFSDFRKEMQYAGLLGPDEMGKTSSVGAGAFASKPSASNLSSVASHSAGAVADLGSSGSTSYDIPSASKPIASKPTTTGSVANVQKTAGSVASKPTSSGVSSAGSSAGGVSGFASKPTTTQPDRHQW